jgi:cytoskeletal protein CcmA (bactofilin family)
VRGALEGEVTAKDRLLVAGSGTVSGTVKVARLVVEDGALLNGTISMERSGPSTNGRPSSS